MLVNAIVFKLDNGFRARLIESSDASAFRMGDLLHNRHFKVIPAGYYAAVVMNISAKGRRVVKHVIRWDLIKATLGSVHNISSIPLPGLVSLTIPAAAMNAPVVTVPYSAFMPKLRVIEDELVKTVSEKNEEVPVVLNEEYYVGDEARLIYNTALRMSEERPERAVKLMMVGPSGYGKTTLPKLFAQLVGKKFMRMNCATIRDPEEWFGYREAREGSTVFIRSQFAKAIEEGDIVVVLDEFNRLEPWLHNTLFPLLDDDGCTVVHDEEFRIGLGVIVVATINVGHEFTGVFELDAALYNRFDLTLEVGSIPPLEEVKVLTHRTGVSSVGATTIVKMANTLRQNKLNCSTRTSLLVARMVVSGLTIREAYETAVVKRISQDEGEGGQRKQVVDLINAQIGNFAPRKLARDVFSGGIDETVAEEPKAKVVGIAVLTAVRSPHLGQVTIIGVIRELSIASAVDNQISFKEAQSLVKAMSNGDTVNIELLEMPNFSQIKVMQAKVSGAGATIRFEQAGA